VRLQPSRLITNAFDGWLADICLEQPRADLAGQHRIEPRLIPGPGALRVSRAARWPRRFQKAFGHHRRKGGRSSKRGRLDYRESRGIPDASPSRGMMA